MYLKRTVLIAIICFCVLFSFVGVSNASDEAEYEIDITANCSCFPPFQSVLPVRWNVELTNIGDKTFNGTLTVDCKTKEGSWKSVIRNVTNLKAGETQDFSGGFSSDHSGRYWITFQLEEESLQKIRLYDGLELIAEANRVQTEDTVFLNSFSDFIAIMAIVVGAIVTIAVAVYRKKK